MKPGLRFHILVLASAFIYIFISYFLERTDHLPLIGSFGILFLIYFYLVKTPAPSVKSVILWAVVIRVTLLFAIPNLSDDFYRFIWDGRLSTEGVNPFNERPSYYMQPGNEVNGLDQELFKMLNSKDKFTIYPPILQGVFFLAAFISPENMLGSVITMRLLILISEILSLYLIIRLLQAYNLGHRRLIIYALNPLIIIELTGNLHFEAFLITGCLAAIYGVQKKRSFLAAIGFIAAITSKLNPLIFLPLLLRKLGTWPSLKLIGLILTGTIILFIPLFNASFIKGISTSIGYYFQLFEFNAGFYYLLRTFGFWIKGYNTIQFLGPALAAATFISIMVYSLTYDSNKPLPVHFLWVYLIYMFFATTVHPWYLTPIVAFALFSDFRFPLIWTFLITFTYTGYSKSGFEENYLLVGVEYILVIGLAIYEVTPIRKKHAR